MRTPDLGPTCQHSLLRRLEAARTRRRPVRQFMGRPCPRHRLALVRHRTLDCLATYDQQHLLRWYNRYMRLTSRLFHPVERQPVTHSRLLHPGQIMLFQRRRRGLSQLVTHHCRLTPTSPRLFHHSLCHLFLPRRPHVPQDHTCLPQATVCLHHWHIALPTSELGLTRHPLNRRRWVLQTRQVRDLSILL